MPLVIPRRERMLLVTSQAATVAEWLPHFLRDSDPIDEDAFASLPPEQRDFLRRWKNTLVTEASKEWAFNPNHDPPIDDLGPDSRDWTRCSLCGAPNRYAFYIVNRLTGSELNVGSECVKRFGFGLTWQDRTSIGDLRAFASEFRVRRLVDARIPGFETRLDEWRLRTEGFEIMLPASVEAPYFRFGEQLRSQYDALRKGRIPETAQTYDDLAATFAKAEEAWQALGGYVEAHRAQRWAPTAQVGRFLRSRGPSGLLAYDMLKQDGEIRARTLHRITEPGFMRSLVGPLNAALANVRPGLIESADPDHAAYICRPLGPTPPRFLLPHSDFFLAYPDLLFQDNPREVPSLRKLLPVSKPLGEEDWDYLVRKLAGALRASHLDLRRHDLAYDDLLAYDSVNRTYLIARGLSGIVCYSAPTAMGLGGPTLDQISERIVANSRSYSRADLELVERYRDPTSQY